VSGIKNKIKIPNNGRAINNKRIEVYSNINLKLESLKTPFAYRKYRVK